MGTGIFLCTACLANMNYKLVVFSMMEHSELFLVVFKVETRLPVGTVMNDKNTYDNRRCNLTSGVKGRVGLCHICPNGVLGTGQPFNVFWRPKTAQRIRDKGGAENTHRKHAEEEFRHVLSSCYSSWSVICLQRNFVVFFIFPESCLWLNIAVWCCESNRDIRN